MIFDHTDLRIGVPEAQFDVEADFEVPSETLLKLQKTWFFSEFPEIFQKCPNAYERV